MKGMNRKVLALAAVMVAAAGAPALAQADQPVMPMNEQTSSIRSTALSDAFETQVPALTFTAAEDRMAAITYMDDALKLIDLGQIALRDGDLNASRSLLMGASGKLTTAYLLNFRDRDFSNQMGPLAMRVETMMDQLDSDSQQAMVGLTNLRNQVASLAETQLATMGGGGGGMPGFEEIEVITIDETAPPAGMDELNIPSEDELD